MLKNSSTYECPICYAINSVAKLHCSCCGTIPPRYSILGKPARAIDELFYSRYIEVKALIGVDRTERHRTVKRTLATVPADYYASVE